MASVILPAIAYAVGLKGIWLFAALVVAAVAGYYIDNALFAPDGPQDESSPWIPSQQIASEGGPAIFCLGMSAVVQGQIIWMDNIQQGTAPNTFTHAAIACARNPINTVKKMWSRHIQFFQVNIQDVRESETIGIRRWGYRYDRAPFGGAWDVGVLHDTPLGIDLRRLKVSRANELAMKGWVNAGNNWDNDPNTPPAGTGPPHYYKDNNKGTVLGNQPVASGTEAGVERKIATFVTDQNTGAQLLIRFAPDIVTETINSPVHTGRKVTLIQDFDPVNASIVDDVVQYNGTPGQAIDQFIAARQPGTGQAYEGVAYVLLKTVQLIEFGSRFPEDIQMVVDQSGTPLQVSGAVREILANIFGSWTENTTADFTETASGQNFFVEDLRPAEVRGYAFRGNISATKALEPLRIAYDMTAHVRWGHVHFYNWDDARIFYVPQSEFFEPITIADATDANLPTSVSVSFTNAEQEGFEVAAVEEHIELKGSPLGFSGKPQTPSVTTMDLRMLTLTPLEARRIARRMLWRPRLQRYRVTCRLTSRHSYLLEGDGFETEFNGELIQVMCQRVERGANGEVQIEGYRRERLPLVQV